MYYNYYLDKVALVTGGGSGIGQGLCQGLAASGAIVICTDIDLMKANETVSMIGTISAIAKKLDVTQLQEIENLFADIIEKHGRIDLVFNNAGAGSGGELRDMSIEHWKKIMDLNFYGVLYGSQIAYRYMIKQGSGHIINTASVAGLVEYLNLIAPYSVSKHAVVNYTRILRQEARGFNVKASVICPGVVSTPIGRNSTGINIAESYKEKMVKYIEKGIPVSKATNYILTGVARNKEVIVFPFQAKVSILFTRIFKGIYRMIMQKQVTEHRKIFRLKE